MDGATQQTERAFPPNPDIPGGELNTHRYNFIDYATQGYLAVVGLIILFLGAEVQHRWLLLCAHVACMGAVHALIRSHAAHPKNRPLDLLRHFYPIIFYTGFYRETGELNHVFVDHYLDGFFASIDRAVFGFQPSAFLMERLPHTWLSELLYASYFSYYIMIVGMGLALYFQGKRQFFRYVSVASFVFYCCYLTYIFVPVVGSRVFWAPVDGLPQEALFDFYPLSFPEAVQAGPFFHIMGFIYKHFEAIGAAFPSSHVAIALCTLYFSWTYLPRIRHLHTVVVILLCIATVYCRYHYVVDIFAGAITGIVLLLIGDWLFWRCQGIPRTEDIDVEHSPHSSESSS